MEPTTQTRYHIRSPDKGFVAAAGRRQIRDFFGNEFFSYVRLIDRRFNGFEYYGVKEVHWSGLPVLCASFPHKVFHDEDGLQPTLDVFPVKCELVADEEWPDLNAAFEKIKSEWDQFISMPETARLHRRVLLFTVDQHLLKTFRSGG